jgi:1,2-diacylglycerol 3-alpha-glucosyltransferase
MLDRAELPDLLHDATIFLSASTTEVHPISVIEAIASGLPIVAVRDEAFEGMILEGENGEMTSLDIDAFNSAIANLLSDPEKLKRYGKRSMEISEKFSIQGQVQALENLYIEAILQNWRGKGVTNIFRTKSNH